MFTARLEGLLELQTRADCGRMELRRIGLIAFPNLVRLLSRLEVLDEIHVSADIWLVSACLAVRSLLRVKMASVG